MKITKGQLKQIIAEEAEKSLTVDAVIAEIAPEVEEMSMAELQLLSMKLDNLIAQLSGRARQRSEQRFEKGVDMYGNPLEESVKIKVPYRKPDIGEEEPEMGAKPSELYKKSRAAATFKSQSMQEQQQPVDYTRHVGNRFQASADGYTERLFLGKKPYEIEVTESGFKVVSAPSGYEKYVGREFTSPGTEGHDNKFWSVAMRELGQAAGREGGIYAPPVPEPVTPEVPPVIDPGPVLAAGDEEESMGESQDVFKRLCEIALKPYGSVLK